MKKLIGSPSVAFFILTFYYAAIFYLIRKSYQPQQNNIDILSLIITFTLTVSPFICIPAYFKLFYDNTLKYKDTDFSQGMCYFFLLFTIIGTLSIPDDAIFNIKAYPLFSFHGGFMVSLFLYANKEALFTPFSKI
jgi:hypothetical protein